MPACQVTEGRSESCYFSLTKAARDGGCASLSTACLESGSDAVVSPAGTCYPLLLLLSCFFPVPYSCWGQLALPFLIISSHFGKEDGLTFGSEDGSSQTAQRCRAPQSAAGGHTSTALLGHHLQLGCPFVMLFPWSPLTQAFVLPHIHSAGENFHPSEAGWKFSTKMQFPQRKHWPWKKDLFCPKWTQKEVFSYKRAEVCIKSTRLLREDSVLRGVLLRSSALTGSALIGGPAQLAEPQGWRQCLAPSFGVASWRLR